MSSSLMIAQAGFTGALLEDFLGRLLTPIGAAVAVGGAAVVAIVLSLRRGVEVIVGTTVFLLSFMMVTDQATGLLIPLIGPLEAVRAVSRPLSTLLLACAALRLLFSPASERPRCIGAASVLLLVFQLYFGLHLLLFYDVQKGVFGIITMSLMFFVVGAGFGRLSNTESDAARLVKVFAWAAIPFVACNLLQLALGYGQAVRAGRFAGIAGNAQQLAAVCTFFLLASLFAYRAALSTASWTRWMWLGVVALVSMFQLWSASRTGLIASLVGVAVMFRAQLGRLLILVIPVALIVIVGSALLEDDAAGLGRYVSAENTRAEVWRNAWMVFLQSPLFGEFPFLRGDEPNGVESSWLRALANMGLIGGFFVAMPFAANVLNAWRISRVPPAVGVHRDLSDFYLGATISLLAVNTAEGVAFGVLTLPVLFTYCVFSLGLFLRDAEPELPQGSISLNEPQAAL